MTSPDIPDSAKIRMEVFMQNVERKKEQREKRKSKILGVVGIVVGILGLWLTIYAISSGKKKAELLYFIDTTYEILDIESILDASDFSLLLNDSSEIEENIYLTTFSIWNSGDLPIKNEDLRTDSIRIHFTGIDRLISSNKIKEIKENISNIKLVQISGTAFNLTWKFFDPNDGIKIQLIYTGQKSLSCKVDGVIYDANIKEFTTGKGWKRKLTPIGIGSLIIGIIGTGILTYFLLFWIIADHYDDGHGCVWILFKIIAYLIVLAAFLALAFVITRPLAELQEVVF